MAKIILFATGGTIASTRTADGSSVSASVSGAALKDKLHAPLDGIEVEVVEFSTVGSFAIDLPLAFSLSTGINAALDNPECDGVVVTHGTDTMEESCYLTHLLREGEKPIVFTGAQRHAGDIDSDGPRNLGDAIMVAASPEAPGLGALIVFEQEIHAARDVTKVHTSRVDTFRSPGLGKIGDIDGTDIRIARRPVLEETHRIDRIESRVELFKLTMGGSPWMLDAAADLGTRGVVLEAFGRGNAPPAFVEAIARLTQRDIPVIVCSRCPEGSTRAVYGGGGGGHDLVKAGAVLAGSLSGVKARLLLSVLLAKGNDRRTIARRWASLAG
ncbi:asparaginase [Jiella pelagia]|uniref:Asparaginase n=1 Tax=Jiella pelagia TaxID=2986949 RepID=A0ABY7C7Z2_9HYPH|nr:asparaginase [Jiella pelagia]WAP70930.1 asparaginase [Jiella pelagia]